MSSTRHVKKGPGRRPQSAKRQRFMELRARGWSVLAAAREVGVSRTCGANWARGYKTYRNGQAVGFVPPLDRLAVREIDSRFLSQDERFRIADLASGGQHAPAGRGTDPAAPAARPAVHGRVRHHTTAGRRRRKPSGRMARDERTVAARRGAGAAARACCRDGCCLSWRAAPVADVPPRRSRFESTPRRRVPGMGYLVAG